MATTDIESIRAFVAPLVRSLGLSLYDVELTGVGHARGVRVVVEKTGGVDLDTISDATRVLAPELSASGMLRDTDVLEVSSPGLERTLRRPEHYQGAVGSLVSVKYLRDGATVRDRGTIVSADDADVENGCIDLALEPAGADAALAAHPSSRILYADIVACRTVFEWGPAPRPGRGSKPGKGSAARLKESTRS
jgi:ribosome maturation factor RimP